MQKLIKIDNTYNCSIEEANKLLKKGWKVVQICPLAEQIETYFGDELCSILNITLFQENNLIFLPEETCDEYSEVCFPSIEYSYDCTPEGEKIV